MTSPMLPEKVKERQKKQWKNRIIAVFASRESDSYEEIELAAELLSESIISSFEELFTNLHLQQQAHEGELRKFLLEGGFDVINGQAYINRDTLSNKINEFIWNKQQHTSTQTNERGRV